jgi:hypothetical protein
MCILLFRVRGFENPITFCGPQHPSFFGDRHEDRRLVLRQLLQEKPDADGLGYREDDCGGIEEPTEKVAEEKCDMTIENCGGLLFQLDREHPARTR